MQTLECDACGKCCLPYVNVSVSDIIRILDELEEDISNWQRYFNLLIDENGSWYQSCVLELKERLGFINSVGLSYLTIDRSASTLSGGEGQRIRLATQISSRLAGVLYVLDEPSIGLHQRDNLLLLKNLRHLKELGNTVLIVEHDAETILASDYVIDMGPGAGVRGGNVVFKGGPEQLVKNKESLTGQYLSGKLLIPVPKSRRNGNGKG